MIAIKQFQSNQRVMLDEDIKYIFESSEHLLVYLRDVFKTYQKKNSRKMTKEEIDSRTKTIDLLRNNLNLLQAEFKQQSERNSSQKDKTARNGKKGNKEFLDVFAVNHSESFLDPDECDAEDDRALTGAERNLLKQFEDNDAELEEIAGDICNALD